VGGTVLGGGAIGIDSSEKVVNVGNRAATKPFPESEFNRRSQS